VVRLNMPMFKSIFNRTTAPRQFIAISLTALSITLLTACGGSGDANPGNDNPSNTGPTPTVVATADTVSTEMDSPINIAVLKNDSGISESSTLNIQTKPANGTATVMANNTITYKPNATFTGKESFSYKVSNVENVSVATVTVNVQCSSCSKEITVNLSWLPTKNDDDIGYLIYYGNNKNDVNSLAFDLSPLTGLDPNAPKISLSAQNDLNLNQGDNVCFQISAYTSTAQSNFSDPVCGVL